MSNVIRYLLTVDATTGATMKVEQLGEAGELTEVAVGSILNPQELVTMPSPQPVVSNLRMAPPSPGCIPGGPPSPGCIPGGPALRSAG